MTKLLLIGLGIQRLQGCGFFITVRANLNHKNGKAGATSSTKSILILIRLLVTHLQLLSTRQRMGLTNLFNQETVK